MLIRDGQKQALSLALRAQYLRRTAAKLQQDFSEQFPGGDHARAESLVSAAMKRAAAYGIRDEADLTFYIRLQAILGPSFDSHPDHSWAREILDRDDLNGTEKIDRIHDTLVFVRNA